MKATQRRIYYIAVIFIFLILAPLLILYASGFRIDIKRKKLVQTGGILIETDPKKAQIILEDKILPKTTPLFIRNIFPGEYNIKIQKEGYQIWEKNIKVEPRKTFILKDILLFKKDITPQKVLEKKIDKIYLSPDKNKVILISQKGEGFLFDFKKEPVLIFTENLAPQELKWLDENNIIFKTKEEWWWMDTTNLETLQKLNLKEKVKKILLKDDKFLILENNVLEKYDITLQEKEIIDKKVKNFWIQGKDIFVLNENLQEYTLNKIDEKGNKEKILSLPKINFNKLKIWDKFLVLIASQDQIFYLFFLDKPSSYKIMKAKEAYLSYSRKKILYFSDYEIGIFDLEKEQNFTLTRSFKKINQVLWLKDKEKYILIASEDKIEILETDLQGTPNFFEIFKEGADFIYLNDSAKEIFIHAISKPTLGEFIKLKFR